MNQSGSSLLSFTPSALRRRSESGNEHLITRAARCLHLSHSGHTVQSHGGSLRRRPPPPSPPPLPITHVYTAARARTGRDVRIGRSGGSPAFRPCLARRIIVLLPGGDELAERGGAGRQRRFSASPERALPLYSVCKVLHHLSEFFSNNKRTSRTKEPSTCNRLRDSLIVVSRGGESRIDPPV